MLTHLSAKNFFLFNDVDIDFSANLTVILGDTGAGKSFLLECIKIALGISPFNNQLVGKDSDSCSVSLEFDITDNDSVNTLMKDMMINHDNILIIRRVFRKLGGSRTYINDQSVSVNFLKQVSLSLLDFNLQGDQFTYLSKKNYIDIIDKYSGSEIELKDIKMIYERYNSLLKKIRQISLDEKERFKNIEYLEHNITELEGVNPQMGEEEQLEQIRRDVMNYEKMSEVLRFCSELLSKGDGALSLSIRSIIKECYRNMNLFRDKELLEEQMSNLETASNLIDLFEDFVSQSTQEVAEFDADRSQERLFTIRDLARKHCCLPDELPAKLSSFQDELQTLKEEDQSLENYKKEKLYLEKEYKIISNKLYTKRRTGSESLQNGVIQCLKKLGMEKARFVVKVDHCSERITVKGSEEIDFIGSMNPGTDLQSIDKVASGGELSRFLLALKSAMSSQLSVKTLIFDEIDTGVNGAIAFAIADQVKSLSKNNQVLIITHSPQVASVGDNYIKVCKSSDDDITRSEVIMLNSLQREEEVAKLLSGRNTTERARSLAKEYLSG
ncbi:MAG: DNA repair protein RecN [Rickettsiales bacterium]